MAVLFVPEAVGAAGAQVEAALQAVPHVTLAQLLAAGVAHVAEPHAAVLGVHQVGLCRQQAVRVQRVAYALVAAYAQIEAALDAVVRVALLGGHAIQVAVLTRPDPVLVHVGHVGVRQTQRVLVQRMNGPVHALVTQIILTRGQHCGR